MYENLEQMSHMLNNLHGILTKGEEHAKEHGLEHDALLEAKLYEDMHALTRQIQACTDTLKFAAGRLSGKTDAMPAFPDEEQTFEELHARLDKAIDYFATFSAEDFEGASERHITLPFAKTMYAMGDDYLYGFAIPNFYFHVTTAYAILRNQGVPVGKRDFIGGFKMQPIEG